MKILILTLLLSSQAMADLDSERKLLFQNFIQCRKNSIMEDLGAKGFATCTAKYVAENRALIPQIKRKNKS